MRYAERRPAPGLARILECVWEVADRAPRAARAPDRIVPDGCPELIVHLGDPFARRVGDRWVVQPRIFLAGTLTRPWLLRAGRRVHTLGMRFRPGAVTAALPVAMAEAADRELPVRALVGAGPAAVLARALRDAGSAAGRARAAQAWLAVQIALRGRTDDGAGPAVALVLTTRGRVPIAHVARRLGWTPRRMERLFRRDLGIRPKLYARIVRLNAALATLDENERSAAVDVALDAGYFDQAHLLRDFRSLAGRKPRAGRAADGAMARHFTRAERLHALLRGE